MSLAICKRLVTLMGGQIGTRNIADSEAEFWITLPLPTDHTPRAEPVEAYAVVLDEITATRVATSALLTRLGVEQDATDTVANAISLLREAREDGATSAVLLVDESVLEGHAKELADQLAAEPVLADTHVVLLTRDPQKDTPPLKPTAIIRKPLLRIEVLQRALTGSGLAADSRPPFEGATSTEPAEEVRPLVLVVDDDEVSRFVTSQLLKRLGCEVELAASGAEAVEKTGQKRYALIFMDCQMPEMDGFATTERIRSGAARPPPIVALTANTAPEDRKRCFSVGMCDFIDKPVHKAELSRVLKRWVKSSAEA